MNRRTELQREVIEALVQTKAINLDAVASVLAKYGTRAALSGEGIAAVINWRAWDICIPVEHLTISKIAETAELEALAR